MVMSPLIVRSTGPTKMVLFSDGSSVPSEKRMRVIGLSAGAGLMAETLKSFLMKTCAAWDPICGVSI